VRQEDGDVSRCPGSNLQVITQLVYVLPLPGQPRNLGCGSDPYVVHNTRGALSFASCTAQNHTLADIRGMCHTIACQQ
jgi:hypothetical protein